MTEKRSEPRRGRRGSQRKEAAVFGRKPPPEVAAPPPLHALTHAAGRSELGAGETLAAAAAVAPWLSPKLTALTRTWPARGCTRGRFLPWGHRLTSHLERLIGMGQMVQGLRARKNSHEASRTCRTTARQSSADLLFQASWFWLRPRL